MATIKSRAQLNLSVIPQIDPKDLKGTLGPFKTAVEEMLVSAMKSGDVQRAWGVLTDAKTMAGGARTSLPSTIDKATAPAYARMQQIDKTLERFANSIASKERSIGLLASNPQTANKSMQAGVMNAQHWGNEFGYAKSMGGNTLTSFGGTLQNRLSQLDSQLAGKPRNAKGQFLSPNSDQVAAIVKEREAILRVTSLWNKKILDETERHNKKMAAEAARAAKDVNNQAYQGALKDQYNRSRTIAQNVNGGQTFKKSSDVRTAMEDLKALTGPGSLRTAMNMGLSVDDYRGYRSERRNALQNLTDQHRELSRVEDMTPWQRFKYRSMDGISNGFGLKGRQMPKFDFGSLNHRVTNVAQLTGTSLYGLGTIGAVAGGVKFGIGAASEAQDFKTTLSGLVNTYSQFKTANGSKLNGADNFSASMSYSNRLYEQLRDRAVKSPLSLRETQQYYLGGYASGASSGLSSKNIMDVTDVIGTLGKGMGLRETDVVSDIRSALSKGGRLGSTEKILQTIGMTGKGRDEALSKSPEEFMKYFNGLVDKFRPAMEKFGNNFTAKWSALLDKLSQSGMKAGEELIKGFLPAIDRVLTVMGDKGTQDNLAATGKELGSVFGTITSIGASYIEQMQKMGGVATIAATGLAALVGKMVMMSAANGSPVAQAIAGIGLLGVALSAWVENMKNLRRQVTEDATDAAQKINAPTSGDLQNMRDDARNDFMKARSVWDITSVARGGDPTNNVEATKRALVVSTQIENHIKSEYANYRNTGGTMPYDKYRDDLRQRASELATERSSETTAGFDKFKDNWKSIMGGAVARTLVGPGLGLDGEVAARTSKTIHDKYEKTTPQQTARDRSARGIVDSIVELTESGGSANLNDFLHKGGRMRQPTYLEGAVEIDKIARAKGLPITPRRIKTSVASSGGIMIDGTRLETPEEVRRRLSPKQRNAYERIREFVQNKVGEPTPLPRNTAGDDKSKSGGGYSVGSITPDTTSQQWRLEDLQEQKARIEGRMSRIDDSTYYGLQKKRAMLKELGFNEYQTLKAQRDLSIAGIGSSQVRYGGNDVDGLTSRPIKGDASGVRGVLAGLSADLRSKFPSARIEDGITVRKKRAGNMQEMSMHSYGAAADVFGNLPAMFDYLKNDPKSQVLLYNHMQYSRGANGEWKTSPITKGDPHTSHIHMQAMHDSQIRAALSGGGATTTVTKAATDANRAALANMITKNGNLKARYEAQFGKGSAANAETVKTNLENIDRQMFSMRLEGQRFGTDMARQARDFGFGQTLVNMADPGMYGTQQSPAEIELLDARRSASTMHDDLYRDSFDWAKEAINNDKNGELMRFRGPFRDPKKATTEMTPNEVRNMILNGDGNGTSMLAPYSQKAVKARQDASQRLSAAQAAVDRERRNRDQAFDSDLAGSQITAKFNKRMLLTNRDIETSGAALQGIGLSGDSAQAFGLSMKNAALGYQRQDASNALNNPSVLGAYAMQGVDGVSILKEQIKSIDRQIASNNRLVEAINANSQAQVAKSQQDLEDVSRFVNGQAPMSAGDKMNRYLTNASLKFTATSAAMGVNVNTPEFQMSLNSFQANAMRGYGITNAQNTMVDGGYAAAQALLATGRADATFGAFAGALPNAGGQAINRLFQNKYKGMTTGNNGAMKSAKGQQTSDIASIVAQYGVNALMKKNSYANEGAQVGGMASALGAFAGLGAAAGPVGMIAGGLIGSLFGKKKERDPAEDAYRKKQLDILNSIDHSLRAVPDYIRTRVQTFNAASAYLGARMTGFSDNLGTA